MTIKGNTTLSAEPESLLNERVFLLVMFFTLFVKLVTAMMIETGGDAVTIWFHVKQLYYGLPYELTHQSVRFGIIIPVYIVMKIFGTHPIVYYIIPFASFLLLVVFIYKIGIILANRTIALFTCILLNIFPWSVVAGLQLLPGYIAAAYIIISFYFIIKPHQNRRGLAAGLVLSGFLFFMAYGAKETALFFLPGLFLVIWLRTGKFRYLVIFGSIPLVLFFGETLFYFIKYGFPYGRLSIVGKTHFDGPMTRVFPMESIWSLLGRFTQMAVYWKATFYVYFIAAVWLFATSMKKEVRYIAIITFSFVFFQTFSVKSISPIIPTQPFNDRHMDLAIPGVMMVISAFFYDVTQRIGHYFKSDKDGNSIAKRPLLFPLTVVSFFALFIIAAYIIALSFFPNFKRGNFFTDHPFALVFKYNRMLKGAYTDGIPIVIRKMEAKRFKIKVDAVNKLIASGKSEKEACGLAGYDLKEYRDSLMRVETGDYKSLNVFVYVFWDRAEDLSAGSSTYPAIDKVIQNGKPFGILMNKKFKTGEYPDNILSERNREVIELTVKPFAANSLTMENFLEKASPVYD